MHIAIVMNNASGVKTLRSDLIRFIQSRGHQVTVVCAADAAASDLQGMGVVLASWPMSRRSINPFLEALSVIRLRRILVTLQADITIGFTPKTVLYCSLASRSTPGSCVFSVLSGLGFLFNDENSLLATLSPLVRVVFRFLLRNNLLVFFQNPDDQLLFVCNRILPRHRTYRVYGSGVDTKRFVPTQEPKKGPETTFLMIARLITAKGVLDYIKAATILKSERCPARVMLLGPFDDHPTAIAHPSCKHPRLRE